MLWYTCSSVEGRMKLAKSKKGGMDVFETLSGFGIGVVALAIILVVAFLIMAETRDQQETLTGIDCNATSGDTGCNATKEMQNATATIPDWVGLIILVAIGGVLLAMVYMFKRGQ